MTTTTASHTTDLPRASGDQSTEEVVAVVRSSSAPRERGSIRSFGHLPPHPMICPARAGINPTNSRGLRFCRNLPRASGDQSYRRPQGSRSRGSAPRERGSIVHSVRV